MNSGAQLLFFSRFYKNFAGLGLYTLTISFLRSQSLSAETKAKCRML
jgi:hypothetical protein